MRKIILVFMIFGFFGFSVFAQEEILTKVGVVALNKVFQEFAGRSGTAVKLENMKKQYNQQIQALSNQINLLQATLVQAQQNNDQMKIEDVQTQIEAKQNQLNNYKRLKQAEINQLTNSMRYSDTSFLKQVLSAISTIASSHGFRVVLNSSDNPDVLFYSDDVDLTADVIQLLHKNINKEK